MKFGVCSNPYAPHGWLPPLPTRDSWAALRALGITHVRLSADLHLLSPAPSVMDFGFLDPWTTAITGAGLKIYMNVIQCPPWASEDQPAYIGLIPGSAWWDTPGNESASGIHFFDPDETRNPDFAAVDKTQPARPWLTAVGTPRISGDFMSWAASQLAGHYGGIVESWGIWNEPGGDLFYPPIRWDDSNHGGLGDVVATRFIPEVVVPFTTGLRSVLPNASTIGVEADGDLVLDRCFAIEAQRAGEPLLFTSALSFHPYGDLTGMGYATMEAFLAITKNRANGRKLWVSEIGGDPQALYDWTASTVAKHPDIDSIVYLDPRYFFEPGSWEAIKPVVSAIGRKFSALFNAVNGRRRAAGTQ
jgi:hypothetical protein